MKKAKEYLKAIGEISCLERPVSVGQRGFCYADWVQGAPTFRFSFRNEREANKFLLKIEQDGSVTFADVEETGIVFHGSKMVSDPKDMAFDVRVQFAGSKVNEVERRMKGSYLRDAKKFKSFISFKRQA